MHLIDKYNPEIKDMFSDIENIRTYFKTLKPEKGKTLNDETYLTNKEVCEKLKISLRTLQEYKDSGLLPFIKISGKILFKDSDIRKLVEENYFKMGLGYD